MHSLIKNINVFVDPGPPKPSIENKIVFKDSRQQWEFDVSWPVGKLVLLENFIALLIHVINFRANFNNFLRSHAKTIWTHEKQHFLYSLQNKCLMN